MSLSTCTGGQMGAHKSLAWEVPKRSGLWPGHLWPWYLEKPWKYLGNHGTSPPPFATARTTTRTTTMTTVRVTISRRSGRRSFCGENEFRTFRSLYYCTTWSKKITFTIKNDQNCPRNLVVKSDFGWHQYPRLQKLRKLTFGLIAAASADSALPRKVRRGGRFKIRI